jgi:nucleotide-binding universal stress UspA family protein
MFTSIVVGTDGSETAHTAVRRAIDPAAGLGARLQIVSAYEPVSDQRLRGEQVNVPADLQWMINPHDDVMALLEEAASRLARGASRRSRRSPDRATPPTQSSTSPRSSART